MKADSNLSRREFLHKAAQLGITASALMLGTACASPQSDVSLPAVTDPTPVLSPVLSPTPSPNSSPSVAIKAADLVVARGNSPQAITEAAIEALGGITRFVKRGDVVVVKPNICASRKPEYAATTNPEVIETIVRLCLGAGAKTVLVFDGPFDGINTAYDQTGIAAAAQRAGVQIQKMSSLKYKKVNVPDGRALKSVQVYDDMLTANVIINVPIAKNHELATLTLGMKNMMGVVLDRQSFHGALGQKVADLNTIVRAHLTIVDAVRILTANGPTGGNLRDVKQLNTVIASADIVAADSFATTLFGKKGADIDYIRRAAEMGLGEIDLKKLNIREISV
ncbi:MAG: DUF362 domain-containing protein [Dehalococcoidia bacterium]|nr:DUF362 domain-containing protein [Dehalococcoidia bacterium]